MYQLSELKKYNEIYDVNHLNCIERPFAVALNSFNPVYRSLFIILLKMSQCYKIRDYEKDLYSTFKTIKKVQYILKKELNIELFEVTCSSDNINSKIEKLLDNNNPIFVPGNLKELFYSNFYKTSDWMHLFLIKGYDQSKNIFRILDSTQRRDDLDYNFYDFVITYDILRNMYISFCQRIYQEKIYFINSGKVDKSLDTKYILMNTLNLFCFGLDNEPYNEITELKSNNLDCDNLFRLANYKEAFLSELIVALQYFLKDNTHVMSFEHDAKHLIEKWKVFDRRLMYNLLKGNHQIIENSLNEIIELEERLRKNCKKFINQLKKQAVVCCKNKSKEHYSIENNEDDIINCISNNCFEFNFDGRKFYNSWLSDDSPKIVFRMPEYDNNSTIGFESNFKIIDAYNAQSYMLGVFFRCNSGNKYFWGINCGNSILFENTGINSKIVQIFETYEEYKIGFTISNKKIQLFYYDQTKEKHTVDPDILLTECVIEYGIECKTWGIPQQMKFIAFGLKI